MEKDRAWACCLLEDLEDLGDQDDQDDRDDQEEDCLVHAEEGRTHYAVAHRPLPDHGP